MLKQFGAEQGRGRLMALSRDVMTDEQRKSVALEYLKAFDNGGVTSTGGSILDLFAEDAQVYFPKWGLATGKAEIGKMFGDVGGTLNTTRISTGSSPAVICWSSRARATASIRTVRGARESPNRAPAAGATSLRSVTG